MEKELEILERHANAYDYIEKRNLKKQLKEAQRDVIQYELCLGVMFFIVGFLVSILYFGGWKG